MAFFESFTDAIRDKWLDYVQANRAWLTLQMEQTSVRTPDGGRRPSSYLILGVVNALEPKLANLMVPFYQLNPDEDALIEVIGLNFDPESILDNRENGDVAMLDRSDAEESPLLPDFQDEIETLLPDE